MPQVAWPCPLVFAALYGGTEGASKRYDVRKSRPHPLVQPAAYGIGARVAQVAQDVRGHEAAVAAGAEAEQFRLARRVPNQPAREHGPLLGRQLASREGLAFRVGCLAPKALHDGQRPMDRARHDAKQLAFLRHAHIKEHGTGIQASRGIPGTDFEFLTDVRQDDLPGQSRTRGYHHPRGVPGRLVAKFPA